MSTVRSFPMPRPAGCPFAEPENFRELRETEPISRARQWDGNEVWLVTRYEDQRAMINDPRFSAEPSRGGYPLVSPAQRAVLSGASSFVFKDDPEHDRLRRAVTPEFTIKRIEAMRPRIQQIVDGAVDDLLAAGPGADLVKHVGLPVPTMVICELLGVPYERRDFFRQRNAILNSRDCAPEAAQKAHHELYLYLDELVGVKEREPGDDLISRVLEEQVRPGRLKRGELVINALLLMLAGQEPTMCMIGLGTAALLTYPEQYAALVESPDAKSAADAVEELLRYLHIGQSGIRRVLTEDVEYGGRLMREGDGVILAGDSADHDEDAFPDPHTLDVTRRSRHHLAFGYGVHYCLGAPLARVQLQTVFATLARRLPTPRLAVPLAEIPFRHDMAIYGTHALPVAW
ncbi:MAG TPA: cytochrome P450 [Actinospica sp.]|jgi:cytochrome P450|nr:cytochrome P450 [Actinospica sp.]